MKKIRLILMVLLVLLAIGAGALLFWNKVINRDKTDAAKVEAAKSFTALDFMAQVKGDADKPHTKYIDTTFEIDGNIDHVSAGDKGHADIFFSNGDASMQCSFLDGYSKQVSGLKKGDHVRLKGRYVGTESDITSGGVLIQFSNCVIEKPAQ